MTDEEVAQHLAEVESIAKLELAVKVAQAKAKRSGALAVVAVCVVVAMALSALLLVFRDKGNSDNANGRKIDALTEELTDTKDLLAKVTATNEERAACSRAFTTDSAKNLSIYLTDLGDLIVAIATTEPGPERDTAVLTTIQIIDQDLQRYKSGLDLRDEWESGGLPLPCPIPT